MIRHALFLPPEGKFLLPIVTHAVFWGPIVLLILLCWEKFCVELRKLGLGITVVVALSLPLGLVAEPRFITLTWPIAVLGLTLTFEDMERRASFKYIFAGLTVDFAQFWMKVNTAPWPKPDEEGLFELPKQIYFMHYGLWLSWPFFWGELLVVTLSVLLLRRSIGCKARSAF